MSAPIFISYRTDDALTEAGRLHQSLENYFGRDTVFYDKDGLKPGQQWPEELKKHVEEAKVVLLLCKDADIWLGVEKFGLRRIDNPGDWVRLEIETALSKGKILIPVLFGNDNILPPEEALPDSLKPLKNIQHLTIRLDRWENDLQQLLDRLPHIIPNTQKPSTPPDPLENLPLPPDIGLPQYPYKGLTWFEESDAKIFFGRENDILKLYQNHLQSPYRYITLLYGQSGAGKSSLLHAGLLPRLRAQGWATTYRRRTRDGAAPDILQAYLDSPQTAEGQSLLILDQLEEIFTHPLHLSMDDEKAEFQRLLRALRTQKPSLRMLLGFRKEYLPEVEALVGEMPGGYNKSYLEVMEREGLARAVGAIPGSALAVDFSDLTIAPGDKDLPQHIAGDLWADPVSKSNATPLLQFILRRMWDEAALEPRAEFSKALYQKHRRTSARELIESQVETLRDRYAGDLDSGLVWDLLRTFVTAEQTAGQSSVGELRERYSHLDGDAAASLCAELKSLYLLSDTEVEGQAGYRLSHDALAPAVLQIFTESTAPGQQARLMLESKLGRGAQAQTHEETPFSKMDLDLIGQGKKGMYHLPEDWKAALGRAEAIYAAQMEKERQQRRHIAGFYLREARKLADRLEFDRAFKELENVLKISPLEEDLGAELRNLLIAIGVMNVENQSRSLLHSVMDCYSAFSGELVNIAAFEHLSGLDFAEAVYNLLEPLNPELVSKLRARLFPEMVPVPGGSCMIGEGNNCRQMETDDFAMARVPTTWAQFYLFCVATGRPLPASPGWGRFADNPVVNVNWYDAVEYANWLSLRLGKPVGYHIDKEAEDPDNEHQYDPYKWLITDTGAKEAFRLPTEGEWEYAARGAESGAADGYEYAGSHEIDEVAWYNGNVNLPDDDVPRTRSVYNTKKPNQLGIYHLSGNVWEWCRDWYAESWPEPLEKGYAGPKKGSIRVLRGGGWDYDPECCRVAFREGAYPGGRNIDIGFRLVFVPQSAWR